MSFLLLAMVAQSCPPKGMVFDYHDKYVGSVYSYDHGIVRLTSEGGMADNIGRCYYKDIKGEIWKLDVATPMKKVAAGAPPPASPKPAPALTSAPPLGVYECDAPHMIGGMVMPNPQPGLYFGLKSASTYRDFNGGTGSYSFSGGILTMTTGPLKGTKYKRTDAKLFKPLDARGQEGSIRCVLNTSKSLTGRW